MKDEKGRGGEREIWLSLCWTAWHTSGHINQVSQFQDKHTKKIPSFATTYVCLLQESAFESSDHLFYAHHTAVNLLFSAASEIRMFIGCLSNRKGISYNLLLHDPIAEK